VCTGPGFEQARLEPGQLVESPFDLVVPDFLEFQQVGVLGLQRQRVLELEAALLVQEQLDRRATVTLLRMVESIDTRAQRAATAILVSGVMMRSRIGLDAGDTVEPSPERAGRRRKITVTAVTFPSDA
jgi:hypothetical protein